DDFRDKERTSLAAVRVPWRLASAATRDGRVTRCTIRRLLVRRKFLQSSLPPSNWGASRKNVAPSTCGINKVQDGLKWCGPCFYEDCQGWRYRVDRSCLS